MLFKQSNYAKQCKTDMLIRCLDDLAPPTYLQTFVSWRGVALSLSTSTTNIVT